MIEYNENYLNFVRGDDRNKDRNILEVSRKVKRGVAWREIENF